MKWLILLIPLFSTLLTGCAGFGYPTTIPPCEEGGIKTLTYPYPTEKMCFESFSITPPQGHHWCISYMDKTLGENETEMGVMMKSSLAGKVLHERPALGEIYHTLTVSFGADNLDLSLEKYSRATGNKVTEISNIEEFIDVSKKWMEKDLSNPIISKINKFEVTPYSEQNDTLCVLISYIIEGNISDAEPNEKFVYDSNTIQCVHPTRNLLFTTHYSERYMAKYPPAFHLKDKYWHEIEPFFHGFQLTP